MIKPKTKRECVSRLHRWLQARGGFDATAPIYFYGASTVGKMLLSRCRSAGLAIAGIFDGAEALVGKKVDGLVVRHADALGSLPSGTQLVVASIIYEREILKRLRAYRKLRVLPLSLLAFSYPEIFDLRGYRERFDAVFSDSKKVARADTLWRDAESRRLYRRMLSYRRRANFGCDPASLLSPHEQYFEKGLVSLEPTERFVDGGAFTGDTVEIFDSIAPKGAQVIAFEPDKGNFRALTKRARGINRQAKDRVVPVNLGLYHETGTVKFCALTSSTSGIVAELDFGIFQGQSKEDIDRAVVQIPVISLDDYFQGKPPPTFIKLDVEGSEAEDLLGARHLLARYKPKPAICVYHRASDLWELPLLIKRLNPEYTFALRHYSLEVCETICYAF